MAKEKKEIKKTVEEAKKTVNKVKENKTIQIISKILYILLTILILFILIVVVLQRFSNNNIALGGFRMFNIVTESMVPKYEVGDVLLSKSVEPSKIKIGDDITYLGKGGTFDGKIVTHQVIDIEENEDGTYKFHTKGIANDLEDPVVEQDQIYGVVIYKSFIMSVISKITTNIIGFYVMIFVPLAILIALKIREIVRNMEEDDDEENEKARKERIKEMQEEKKKKTGDE